MSHHSSPRSLRIVQSSNAVNLGSSNPSSPRTSFVIEEPRGQRSRTGSNNQSPIFILHPAAGGSPTHRSTPPPENWSLGTGGGGSQNNSIVIRIKKRRSPSPPAPFHPAVNPEKQDGAGNGALLSVSNHAISRKTDVVSEVEAFTTKRTFKFCILAFVLVLTAVMSSVALIFLSGKKKSIQTQLKKRLLNPDRYNFFRIGRQYEA